MTFRSPVSRRSLLKALGSAAAVAPLSSLLTASITEAAAPVAPLRLITLFGYYHTSEPFFHPHDVASSAPARAGSAFTLNFPNSVLAPLAPHQNKLMVIRGLNYESPATTPNGGHSSGQTVLTGSHCVYGTNACDGDGTGCRTTGTSIDQFLFSRLGHSGSRQPIVARLTNQATPICFANGVALPGVRNPTQLFNSYFAGTVGGGSSQAVRQLARRNSAIGFASDGARSLASRLAGSEKAKLDQHLSALQGLKSSLNASLPVTNSCSPPAAGSISNDPGTNTGGADVGKYRPDTESFLTLISQAFACDLTRFATLILPDLAGADLVTQMAGLENFAATADDLHGYGHGATGANDNDCDLKSALHSREWASVVQRLMNKLEAISDPMAPGQTAARQHDDRALDAAPHGGRQSVRRAGARVLRHTVRGGGRVRRAIHHGPHRRDDPAAVDAQRAGAVSTDGAGQSTRRAIGLSGRPAQRAARGSGERVREEPGAARPDLHAAAGQPLRRLRHCAAGLDLN